jgi:hypothetical protein
MTRTNLVLGGVSILSLLFAGWMFLENRGLEDDLASSRKDVSVAEDKLRVAADPWSAAGAEARSAAIKPPGVATVAGGPELDRPKKESVLERRIRMTEMMTAMFGRGADETEQEYRDRVGPMISGALEKNRGYAKNRRRSAEAAAGVSPEQSAAIDAEINKTYSDVIDYANTAIADGQVSPYSRNVSGLLQFAGGLGTILNDAESRFGKILSPAQIKAMYDHGFEWGEYLGFNAPWETLNPPPPPPGGGGS